VNRHPDASAPSQKWPRPKGLMCRRSSAVVRLSSSSQERLGDPLDVAFALNSSTPCTTPNCGASYLRAHRPAHPDQNPVAFPLRADIPSARSGPVAVLPSYSSPPRSRSRSVNQYRKVFQIPCSSPKCSSLIWSCLSTSTGRAGGPAISLIACT
jgi:hypothetical protein